MTAKAAMAQSIAVNVCNFGSVLFSAYMPPDAALWANQFENETDYIAKLVLLT